MKSLAPANVSMRSSCSFCRQRKIRCSGTSICSACKERNIDCVYEAESSKGRPRNGSRRLASKLSSGNSTPQIGALSLDGGYVTYVPSDLGNDNIFYELRNTFEEFFGKRSSYPTKKSSPRSPGQFDPAVQDFYLQASENTSSTSLSLPAIDTDKILETINYEIIESVCNSVSNIGCEPLARHRSKLVSKSLPLDRTQKMFDPPTRQPVEDPLLDYEGHTTLQMIDVWLSIHPLSCILSKTLFLRSLKNNECDPALLSIILSDSSDFSIRRGSQNEEKFFAWAINCLQSVTFQTATVSTAQTLVLLGWRELRRNRPRQAICYLSVAARVVRFLWESLMEGDGPCTSQINGVSEGKVETELIINMYWVIASLKIWILLQIDASLIDLEDSNSFTTLPISNETDSKLIELDIASNNVSTLNAQARSLRGLLSLSVTTLMASRLLAIHDQHERFFPGAWPNSGGSQPSDKRMLMESFTTQARLAIKTVCENTFGASQSPLSQAESDLMYSVFEFAVAFPHTGTSSPQERTMDKKKAEDLLALVKHILQQPLLAPHFTGEEIPTYNNAEPGSELIAMILDISARVLQDLANYYVGDRVEAPSPSPQLGDLIRITSMLLDLLRSDHLPFSGSRVRPTKRLLKRVKIILEHHPNSTGSLQAMDYSSIGTSSRSSNSSTSPWPVTTQAYSAHGIQIPQGLDTYNLTAESYLRHHGGPSDPMQYDLSPHAASHGIPVTTGAPEIQLPAEYGAYSLDDHITTTFPEEHYRMNLATSGPEQDRRRARQYRNLSRHLVFDMDTQYGY